LDSCVSYRHRHSLNPSTKPALTGQWQEYSRTHDLTGNAGVLGQGMDLTIVLGVVDEPATMALLASGGLGLISRRRNG